MHTKRCTCARCAARHSLAIADAPNSKAVQVAEQARPTVWPRYALGADISHMSLNPFGTRLTIVYLP
jgi:hypothetical protein